MSALMIHLRDDRLHACDADRSIPLGGDRADSVIGKTPNLCLGAYCLDDETVAPSKYLHDYLNTRPAVDRSRSSVARRIDPDLFAV